VRLERKNCLDCGSPLGPGAIKCRCGWKLEPAAEYSRPISCCFAGCANNATIRVWTRTGWANVCEADYGRVEIVPRVSTNPTVQAIREAYQRRKATNERLAKEAA